MIYMVDLNGGTWHTFTKISFYLDRNVVVYNVDWSLQEKYSLQMKDASDVTLTLVHLLI